MTDKRYDTIIIGSGISGMAAGIMLAKEGEQVLVVEQHSIAGGLTQTYVRKGNIFPTGVHRLGSLKPGQPLWYYFKYLGLMEALDLVRLDDDCFERVFFPGDNYKIPMSHEAYQNNLVTLFPNLEKSIVTYFSDLNHVISNVGNYNPSIIPGKDLSLQHTGSLKKYLESIGISGRLENILTSNSPLYGLSSRECPVLTHFLVSDSYFNSCFRVNETTTPFSDTLVKSFESKGGKVKVKSCVTKLMIKDKTVTGVLLDNDEALFSKKVIFTGHPSLLLDICPHELFRPVFRKRLNQSNTPGIFGLALKWEKYRCPVEKNDVYLYDSWDVNEQYGRDNVCGDDPLGMVYLSSLPNTDKSDQHFSVTALTGISATETAVIKTYYKDTKNDKYKTIKSKMTQKILDHIQQVYPDSPDAIEVVDAYSPVTFQRYTLTKNGTAYGIKKTAQHFLEGMFSPATKVKNLFLTGQSIGFSGIHGAIVSSVNLCQVLLGKQYLTDKIVQIK